VVDVLRMTSREPDLNIHVGGNTSCEALYRITPKIVVDFCNQ